MNALPEAHRVRSLVVAGSAFGLSIAIALGIGAVFGASGQSDSFLPWMLGVPFVVALVATRFARLAHQRVGWATAAVLAGVTGIALVTSVGIFYLAISAGYFWAVVASGRIPGRIQNSAARSPTPPQWRGGRG